MNKTEILNKFRNQLSYKDLVYLSTINQRYFSWVQPEQMFQFCVTKILDKHGIDYVLLQNESKKTQFERFLSTFVGNKRGWSDIFIPKYQTFWELKTENPYKKDGKLRSSEHLEEQNNFMLKMNEIGYNCKFVYPDNFDLEFESLINK